MTHITQTKDVNDICHHSRYDQRMEVPRISNDALQRTCQSLTDRFDCLLVAEGQDGGQF